MGTYIDTAVSLLKSTKKKSLAAVPAADAQLVIRQRRHFELAGKLTPNVPIRVLDVLARL